VDPLLVSSVNPKSYLFRDLFEIVFCNLIVGIAVVCQPHIITKSLLLRNDRDVNRYLLTGIIAETIFFAVVITGLWVRLRFPDLTDATGKAIPMDGLVSAYVVQEFPVFVGLVVILGLLSAGLSTLEGLVQSVPTTITWDILKPLLGNRLGSGEKLERQLVLLNKVVIAGVGGTAIWLSHQQLVNPTLSVGIFAQNGVYAYFAAAFMPVILGIFFKEVPVIAPFAASVTAIVVHFGVYYGRVTWYMQDAVRNPAIAVTFAILASTLVGFSIYFLLRKSKVSHPDLSKA
jgi:sodium/pantothenate symporter